VHGLIACGGEDGALECFDLRQKAPVGRINAVAPTGNSDQVCSCYCKWNCFMDFWIPTGVRGWEILVGSWKFQLYAILILCAAGGDILKI
jgi:hypothetical protein